MQKGKGKEKRMKKSIDYIAEEERECMLFSLRWNQETTCCAAG